MLSFKMVSENVLEVKETIMSFTKDKVSYWYYDIKNWKKSMFGTEGEIPSVPMSAAGIDWVKKYYLQKVTK